MTTPPTKLPNLRKGLVFSFSDYDPDGKPQWLIHDQGRNKFFVIGWIEYELLQRWDAGTAEALINEINEKTTLHVDMRDVDNLILFLGHNYLVDQSGPQIYKRAKEQKLFKEENKLHWLISYYLFFRIPLWHPDNFLTHTKKIGKFLFSPYTFYLMSFLGVIAIYQISVQWETFIHTFASIFTLKGLFFSMIAFIICKFCHELGHAYMCKRYGVPVPTFGVAFLVFWPVLYTDTTLSWSLNSSERLRIALAGIWVETYVTIIAALIWCNVNDRTIQAICYVTITVNWLSSILINVSPFMRFDGYYVLADYLKIPNLQHRAFALARWQLRRWLFDWQDPPPEKFSRKTHAILVIYSYLTWIYRLSLYIAIALLVYHFFFKLIGIILLIIELYVFIAKPLVMEIKEWIQLRDRFTLNAHTITTITITSLLLIWFFIPTNTTSELPATLSYKHQFLIAPTEGVIASEIPLAGAAVKSNQPIIKINSPQLDYALQKVQLEYKKTLSELRRATINPKYSNQQGALLSDIAKQEAENRKLLELREQLTLKVPFDGIIKEISAELYTGVIVMTNEWLGDVIDPITSEVEAYISQMDKRTISVGLEGNFYPNDINEEVIPVKVTYIESLNAAQLTCQYATKVKSMAKQESTVETPCYNSSDLGGHIATFESAEGTMVPVDSVYRVVLKTLSPVKMSHVERGSVYLNIPSHSYAYRLFYNIKKILIEESGF